MTIRAVTLTLVLLGGAAFAQESPPPAPPTEPQATEASAEPAAPEAAAEETTPYPIVEAVEIARNQYIPKETLLYYVSTKPGERYDEVRLRQDFRRLWDTGFLDDLSLEVNDGARGKVVTFYVRERRRIMIVDYRGSKVLTKTAIEDKLKEKEATLRVDTFYDLGKVRKVESIIRQMLEEAGRPFGTVKHDPRPVAGSGVQVSFVIDDGPKTRVKEIVFLGNRVFGDGTLARKMKKIRARGFWNLSWLMGKTTHTEEKWQEDQKNLQDFYLNQGYVTATIGPPNLFYFEGKAGLFKKRPARFIRMEIPVVEGDQYRVGEVKFEGLTVFKEEGLRHLFKLKAGDVYKESRIKKGYEKLRDYYGAQGYIQFTSATRRKPDPDRKVVDVTLAMEEDKRYYVGKIRFTGNDTTRDKVIRREVYLNEGDVLNTEALKLSIKRVNQLGYFKPMEGPPELAPSPGGQEKLDITFKVEEQNRNQFTLGGGHSGYEGTFLNASFSTSNFLGAGETFQVSAQSGARVKNYQIAVTEPYFLDRPITAGIDLYKRRIEYLIGAGAGVSNIIDGRTGGSVTGGLPLGRWSRMFANYTYEVVDIQQSEEAVDPRTPFFDPTRRFGFLIDDIGKRRESRLTPSVVHNTVDNPYTPRSGLKLSGTFQAAGGPLGGTLNYLRPDVEAIVYLPHTRRTALGVRGQVGWVLPYGATAKFDEVKQRDGLPYYNRFAVGGENQVRGYPFRALIPAKKLPDGTETRVYGDKFLLFNAEYYFDIAGPFRALAFFDAGQAYLKDERFDLKKMKISTGVELRFVMPVLNVPFRLIYSINPNLDAYHRDPSLWGVKSREFKFAVGTTF